MFAASPIFHYSLSMSRAKSAFADEILTIKEVARYLKLAEKTAYRLAAEGKFPGFKVGGSWRFRRQDMERWISSQQKNGTRER